MAPLQPASRSPPEVVRVRLVFLGAAGVGKTALIRRFLHDAFEARHRRTVEELHALELEPEAGPRLRLEVLDTSGSYRFPAMRRLGIRHGHAFALVYSPRDAPDSFEELERLRAEILEAKEGVGGAADAAPPPLLVVANKSDLPAASPELEGRLAETVRREWGARYLEASAKRGSHVGRLFQELLTLSRAEALLGGPRRLSPALRRRRRSDPEAAGEEEPPRPPLPRRRLASKGGGPSCAIC